MQGLSLDQAPPYKIPLFYYMTGAFYLLLFSGTLFYEGLHVGSRYDSTAIVLTHLLTLGFFTHIMFGTLFQMVPVIIGEAYKNVEFQAKMILFVLNLGTLAFMVYLVADIKLFMTVAILFLGTALLYFAIYSLLTISKTKDKNPTVKTFLTALVFLALGAVFGIMALLQHSGIMGGERYGDIHFSIMVFGWVFMLFSGVAYKVLPMFYVAREYPIWIKNYFYILVSLTLFSTLLSTFFEFETGIKLSKTVLALLALVFAVTTIVILKNRKRARKDSTVDLFYFANINLAVGAVIWIIAVVFDLQLDFLLGILFGLGFVYGLINGMLYKIVPFLTWFHLSSSFVYEAEMSEVIKTRMMKMQSYLFMASYAAFLSALFFQPLVFVASALLFISSSLLLYNLTSGYGYHSKMIKKALKYEQR